MSERIRDLLPNPFAVDYQVENGPLDLYTEKEMIRFAELIVKECAKVARHTDLEDVEGGDSAVLRAASEAIENYFGVK